LEGSCARNQIAPLLDEIKKDEIDRTPVGQETRNAYRILVIKLEWKEEIGSFSVESRIVL
jgi:hypothetical protein